MRTHKQLSYTLNFSEIGLKDIGRIGGCAETRSAGLLDLIRINDEGLGR